MIGKCALKVVEMIFATRSIKLRLGGLKLYLVIIAEFENRERMVNQTIAKFVQIFLCPSTM